jgi:hypothetical protein
MINPVYMPHPVMLRPALTYYACLQTQVHLHGHDFAIIAQKVGPYNQSEIVIPYNPPRRDVVMLPGGGYVVIAFKADNPGAWLLHCHIVSHASGGLDMQILEDLADARSIWGPGNAAIKAASDLCTDWTTWCASKNINCSSFAFQPDSGV